MFYLISIVKTFQLGSTERYKDADIRGTNLSIETLATFRNIGFRIQWETANSNLYDMTL
jgi:hypothetical protein